MFGYYFIQGLDIEFCIFIKYMVEVINKVVEQRCFLFIVIVFEDDGIKDWCEC